MPNGKKGMKYNEWAANKSESSKKNAAAKRYKPDNPNRFHLFRISYIYGS